MKLEIKHIGMLNGMKDYQCLCPVCNIESRGYHIKTLRSLVLGHILASHGLKKREEIEKNSPYLNKTNNCQQIKKGEEVTLTTDNHLETRSDAEEDNKKSDKTADVDNQSVDNITGRWGRGYARRSAGFHGITLSKEKGVKNGK